MHPTAAAYYIRARKCINVNGRPRGKGEITALSSSSSSSPGSFRRDVYTSRRGLGKVGDAAAWGEGNIACFISNGTSRYFSGDQREILPRGETRELTGSRGTSNDNTARAAALIYAFRVDQYISFRARVIDKN